MSGGSLLTRSAPAAAPWEDAADRDSATRRRMSEDLSVSLFVEAGAGTGKTRELVRRVVALVASGEVLPEGIVAITFTEAAAAELRDRVRRALEDGSADPTLLPVERRRCSRALGRIDRAAITTLHGFARLFLVEHSSLAGLPPDFEVLDEIQADVRFEEDWAAFVSSILEGPEMRELIARALALGGRTSDLREIARGFSDNWDRVLAPEGNALPRLESVDLGTLRASVLKAVRVAEDVAAGRLADRARAELVPFLDRLDRVVAIAGAGSGRAVGMVVQDLPDVKVAGSTPAAAAELRRALDEMAAERDRLVAQLADEVLAALKVPLARFALGSAEQRLRDGQLEFHDLLVRAVLLLRDHPDARQSASERYGALLIDELQDTDPLQAEMASLLGVTRTCFVGDPKQSIYRFRRADLAVYEQARDNFDGEVATLSRNYRSVPGVLDWVNAAFGSLMEAQPGAQPAFASLDAERPSPAEDVGSAPVVGIGGPRAGGRVAELRQVEALEMAEIALELCSGSRTIEDSDGVLRPLRFDDMAVLLPTRAALGAVERGFERAGVPYRIESRSLLFATDEIHDVLVVLSAIDDPTDEIATVAALRGVGLACSDLDLLGWRLAGGTWSSEGAESPEGLPEDHPVAQALASIEAMREVGRSLPVNLLVDLVIRECRFVELAVTARRPRDRWRRYRLLLDEARAFVEGGGKELGEFVRWTEQQMDAGATRLEVAAPEEDDRAVRILTVHGAKGLEFPVVMLAGLNAVPATTAPPLVWAGARPELSLGRVANGVRTPGYRKALADQRRQDELERIRLLYVACTRARELLVVGLHHREGSNCTARKLVDLDGEAALPWQRYE